MPTARRLAVGFVQDGFGVSQRRSCDALGVARSTCRYQSQRGEDPVRAPLWELATRRRRFGYRRLGRGFLPFLLLERAGLARMRGDAGGMARALAEARRLFAEMGVTGWDDYARSIEA